VRFALVVCLLGCGSSDPGGVPLDAAGDGGQHCLPVHDAGGPFISASQRTVWEEEPHLAATGSGDIVAGWIDIFPDHNSSIGYAVSHDQGETWARPGQIDSPGARVGSDPTVAVDSHGNFYLAWVGYLHDSSGNTKDMHIYVSRLDGATGMFQPPVEASDFSTTLDLDKPWMTIDANDDVILTWEDSTHGNQIVIARSTDHGATFSQGLVAVAEGEFLNLAFPCLDRSSGVPLYVVANSSQHNIVLFASEDHGVNFARRPQLADDAVFHDPTCVARGNEIWVSYDLGADNFVAEQLPLSVAVRVMHSGNRGLSFDRSVLVSNAPIGTQYLLSTLALGSALELVYYQGISGGDATLERATSTDGGLTWKHTTLTQPGVFITARGAPCFPGDYFGTVAAGGSLYIAYSDNTNGRVHTAFHRFPSP
jgi:hypothetical protein